MAQILWSKEYSCHNWNASAFVRQLCGSRVNIKIGGKWIVIPPKHSNILLVGGWATPLKNMSSSVGMIVPNWMESHKSHVPVTTNQTKVLTCFNPSPIGSLGPWFTEWQAKLDMPWAKMEHTEYIDLDWSLISLTIDCEAFHAIANVHELPELHGFLPQNFGNFSCGRNFALYFTGRISDDLNIGKPLSLEPGEPSVSVGCVLENPCLTIFWGIGIPKMKMIFPKIDWVAP